MNSRIKLAAPEDAVFAPSNANESDALQSPADSAHESDIRDPKDPLPIARDYRGTFCMRGPDFTIHSDGSTFDMWDGNKYADKPEAALRAELYPWLEQAKKNVKRGDSYEVVPFAPTPLIINNVIDALHALAYTTKRPPAWLTGAANLPNPVNILPTPTGLIHLRPDAQPEFVGPPTPLFYCKNAIEFGHDHNAPRPTSWLHFLDQLWADDPEAIQAFQEWCGYCLTPDTSQQKALLLVGPKRAGKGTLARILSKLIGTANVCGPTLSGLSTNFGLWALIGKLLAIVSDARLSGRTDQAIITERILAITGEDALTIDRKNLEPLTQRLPTRLMILTNELPRLSDASGALASRFVILTLTQSFYGKEDTTLEGKLTAELPGILNWAIEGWQRLRQRGHFQQPASSAEAILELNDLSSPISAFVRDWCRIDSGAAISAKELYETWCAWCHDQGRQAGTQQIFGRDLRAAIPGIGMSRPRGDEGRQRQYEGITVTPTGATVTAQWRSSGIGRVSA